MEKEKISRRIEGIEPPIDTNYIKSVMAVKFSRDIADCIPEIDDTTFSDEFKNDEFESKLYENLEEVGFLKQDEYGDYYGTGPLKKYGSYLNDFVYEITQAVEKLYIDADESCSILKSETKFDQLSLGIEVEKQKKLESLPVDRHLWYKGRIFLEEMKFAELPESIQNHAKHQIITCDTNDDSPDGAVMGANSASSDHRFH